MKVKFLNLAIEIVNSERVLPYPFYDVNYAYRTIFVSSNIHMGDDCDKELLNSIILKGCIDIANNYYTSIGSKSNPVFEYLVSKIDVLKDVYTYRDGKKEFIYKGGNK